MSISVAADERTGVAEAVVDELRRRGHEPIVHGALSDEERDDWAWASEAAARDVAEGRAEQGIVCCWTGTGASIAANKVRGRPGGALRRRRDRPRRPPLERRERAGAVAAHARARRCSRRSSTAGSRARRARTRTTWRTSATWTRSPSGAGPSSPWRSQRAPARARGSASGPRGGPCVRLRRSCSERRPVATAC